MLEPFSTDATTLKVGKYKHYSGKQYEVLGVGRHSETLEEVVVYKAVVEPFEIWVRPLQMFIVTVEIDGKVLPRFIAEMRKNKLKPKSKRAAPRLIH